DKVLPDKDSPLPVIGMTRRDAIIWCNAYSEMMKLKPVYCSDPEFKNPIKSAEPGEFHSTENKAKGGFDNPYVNWAGNGYRLPTEAEWLYAVSYIDGKKWLDPAVLGNDANGLGFVYVPGRITEWLWDFYAEYPKPAMKDYRGPDPDGSPAGSPNVLHGGYTEKSVVDPNTFNVSAGYRVRKYALVGDIRNGFRVAASK
ncbi:MAG TPA: SUMF1/EgtB/PvdO family nonheme iron enzyme, partial [Candidatus Goldiibacteriota bacterium]|nr:SUMF1/EgtB/PvdO family nonheme iron enzyme [Candidatus Goldiibacteriota bacterium]